MRVIAAALLFVALPAFAAYDVTVTIPPPDKPAQCQLYLDGVKVGVPRVCDTPQAYPGLFPADGTYVLRYTYAMPDAWESALSPTRTVVTDDGRPSDPTTPLNVVVECDPTPCPSTISIIITPAQ
jgi:hypothetical protein